MADSDAQRPPGTVRRLLVTFVALCAALAVALAVAPAATAGDAAGGSGAGTTERRFVAQFRPGVDDGAAALSLLLAGIDPTRVVSRVPELRLAVLRTTTPQADALARNPLVSYVAPDVLAQLHTSAVDPGDPLIAQQGGLADIGVPQAWAIWPGPDGFAPGAPFTGAPIAVIDSGVDDGHVEFAPFATKVPVCRTFGANFLFDPGPCTNSPDDTISHGTHVAGIAAGNAGNGAGAAGVAPRSPVLSYKACAGRPCWFGDVASGLIAAVNDGAKVANMSLGGPVGAPFLADAVRYALRNDVVLVASAGNTGDGSLSWPAAYNGVLSVAALRTGTTQRADFSTFNAQVDLAAPGTSILAPVAPPAAGGEANAYRRLSGTSMAAPHVAGAAALVRSAYPDWSAGKVRGALINTADDIGPAGVDPFTGHGRVNVPAALAYDPVDDGDRDDDGVPDEWDGDPDDPSQWVAGSANGSVFAGGASVDTAWIDFFGLFSFGFVTVTTPQRTIWSFVSGPLPATAIDAVTIAGNGLSFGTDGIRGAGFRALVVERDGARRMRLEVDGALVVDGPAGGWMAITAS
jgi:subtilisin family serine protease